MRIWLTILCLALATSASAQQTVRTTGSTGGSGGDITISGSAPDVGPGTEAATTLRTTEATDSDLTAAVQAVQTASEATQTQITTLVGNLATDGAHDNAAVASGPVMLCEFDDSTPDSVDEGDGGRCRISANRNLYTTLRDAAGNERGLNIDANNAASVAGGVAHDAADAGSPIKIGFKATSSVSGLTLVANNDRTDAFAGLDGVIIQRPHANLEDRVSAVVGVTDGSSTSLVAAQGASTRFCATTLVVSNSSATNVTVDIRDGTAGSVIATIPAAANMGGAVVPLAVPLCTSANTAMAMDPSAAATTVTVTAVGFKTKL